MEEKGGLRKQKAPEKIKLRAKLSEKKKGKIKRITRVDEQKRLKAQLSLKTKKPDFRRQESWRYKKIGSAWRRPKGIDSKMRLRLKGWPKHISVGYRPPKALRYLHPSGKKELIVFNVGGLEEADSKKHIIRIAHTVGTRKRLKIIDQAEKLKLRVANPGGVKRESEE